MGVIENIKARGLKDIANPKKWGVVMEFETIRKHGITVEVDEIIPFAEQIVYRTVVCAPCLELGKCEHCKCDMPDAMQTPSNWCSADKWGPYMSPEEWAKFKEEKGLIFLTANTK